MLDLFRVAFGAFAEMDRLPIARRIVEKNSPKPFRGRCDTCHCVHLTIHHDYENARGSVVKPTFPLHAVAARVVSI